MNTARGLHARLQHPWPRTAAGFTLIEVLIALLLVGAGLLAMSGLQSNLSRHTDLSRQRGEATLLAQAGMETLRHQSHLPTANLGLTAQEPQRNPLTSGSESIASDHFNTRYTRRWTVQGDVADALRPGDQLVLGASNPVRDAASIASAPRNWSPLPRPLPA